jgi:hypothetical protein
LFNSNLSEGVESMKIKLSVAAVLAGTLLATCLVSGSAEATPVPVLKGHGNPGDPGIVTLVGRKGGGGGGGKGLSRGGGGMKGFSRGGGGGRYAYGGGGGKRYYGGGGGGKRYYGGGGGGKRYYGGGDRRHYAYKDGKHHDNHVRFRRYAHYGWYGAPFLAYGYYGGGCGWLYRNAIATGDPYWWNRYYECTGYY